MEISLVRANKYIHFYDKEIQYFIDCLFAKKFKNWKILKNIKNIQIVNLPQKKNIFSIFQYICWL